MGRTSHDGKLQKFSTSMITRLIDAGRISIERLVKHVQYLQRSASWPHLDSACSAVVLGVYRRAVLHGHLRSIVQPEIWVVVASAFLNVTNDLECARRIEMDSPEWYEYG